MRYATTALRCWLTAAALLLALCCPLPVFAARAGAVLPVTVRTEGAATDAACVVSITPLDAAPAPAQASLTIQGSGTAYFTGFAFDAPGDYRYTVTQAGSGRPHMTCDTAVYTVTVRVTGRADGGLDTELWAQRGGSTAKAAAVSFVNRYDPPAAPAARTAKGSAAPALPQTGDAFPVEALAAALCAGVVGFATAWSKHR
ncbi:Spy0128 family protein [Gemmiger sp.]|uniref:Spy0128 family protein n=1 Tax=Gemmiger sp. TaxID=2049027 RepID=UPI003FD77EC0